MSDTNKARPCILAETWTLAELALARKYIWFEEPEALLLRPGGLDDLRCQILSLATPEDYRMALDLWGEAAMRRAFASARPGQIDDRSWNFWNLVFNQGAGAAPPARRFIFADR